MEKALKTKELIKHMLRCGFHRYKPACFTWDAAFILKRDKAVLCVLIRKNGIDLRFYENYNRNIKINQSNLILMRGGKIYRNHYNESNNLITQKIKIITSRFSVGKISDEITIEDGRSYLLNKNFSRIKQDSKSRYLARQEKWKVERQDARDWRGIVAYVRDDCGGYWGDGQWM